MYYIVVGNDYTGPFGSFGVDAVVKPRRRSVGAMYQKRLPDTFPKAIITKQQVAAFNAQINRRITAVKMLRAAPSKVLIPLALRARAMGAFGYGAFGSDDVDRIVEQLAAQGATLEEIRLLTQTGGTGGMDALQSLGANMLTSRAGAVAGDMGLDFTRRDLGLTALRELAFRSGASDIAAVAGGGNIEQIINAMSGMGIGSQFRSQGWALLESVGGGQSMEAFSSNLESVYGDLRGAWTGLEGRARECLSDAAAYAGTGIRRLVEDAQDATGGWLNGNTLQAGWSMVSSVIDLVNAESDGAKARAVGNTVATLGGAIPGPVGACISAAGTFISLISNLFDMNDVPPAPLVPCAVTQSKQDAWICLKLFLVADTRYGTEWAAASRQSLSEGGWDVTLDQYTGEVMVKKPGSNIYKRILDLFDRNKLLESYINLGDVFEWVSRGSGPLQMWPNLWCMPTPDWVLSRYVLAETTSPAGMFRVRYGEDGKVVMPRSGVADGPKALGVGLVGYDVEGFHYSEAFFKEYRAACMISAYLGGTVPFGRLGLSDGGGICTGVGGRREGNTLSPEARIEMPFMCRAEADGRIWVMPPVPWPKGDMELRDSRAIWSKLSWTRGFISDYPGSGSYFQQRKAEFSGPLLISPATPHQDRRNDLGDLMRDEAWQIKYRVATSSPPLVEMPPSAPKFVMALPRKLQSLQTLRRASGAAKHDTVIVNTGMSPGTKVVLGLGALALVGGGGLYLWQRSKERR